MGEQPQRQILHINRFVAMAVPISNCPRVNPSGRLVVSDSEREKNSDGKGNMGMSLAVDGMLATVTNREHEPNRMTAFPTSSPNREKTRAEDDELVQKCRRGDLSAFETIYQRHSSSMYNLAYRMVGNPSDAEDLLQEIFLLAFNKLSSYQGQSALGTWLYRVATNRCLDHLRSRAKRYQTMTDSIDEKESLTPSAAKDTPVERVDLERSIAQLPDSYRAAFLLYDVEGFGHKEVAHILGVAEGTSKSLVHKARLKIRDTLGQGRTGAMS